MELTELEKTEKVEKLGRLNEEVFKFLLKKREADPSLRYTLRTYDTRQRLTHGNWFLGSEVKSNLYISFWNIYGVLKNKGLLHPAIRFEMDVNGESNLFIDTHGCKHPEILAEIAASLGLIKKPNGIEWRTKDSGIDAQNKFKGLEHFITTQRPFINSFFKLRGVENDFPSIGEVEFLARLAKIENIRAGREETSFKELIENKLFVETLKLSNINAFKTLDISFNKQVTCFVGGNGSGKTTILRAIALGLVGLDAFKIKPNLLAIQQAKSNAIYEKKGEIDVSYRYEGKGNEHFGVYYTSIDEGVELREGKNLYSQKGLLSEEEALKALIIGFAQQSYAEPKISKRQRPNIADIEALMLNEPNNRFQEFVNWFQEELKKDLPEYHKFRDTIISKILNVINDCIRKEEKNIDNDIDFVGITEMNFVTYNNPEGIPIDKLSQGYRNVLGWVGFLAKRMYEYKLTLVKDGILSENIDFLQLPAVCLIDEIDTYLHPDWQYSILKGLVESFPNVQFIITSHSPFVLTSVPSDKLTIYQLNTEGGQIEVKEMTENLYGADANRATSRISDDRTPKFAKLFSRLQNDIDNDRLEDAKALLKHLIETEHVDEDLDLNILRAKRLIRTKEILNPIKSKIIQ
jgi:predicted ATP-binding protein involved in virulence